MILVRLTIYDPDDNVIDAISSKDFELHDVYTKPEILVAAMDLLLKDFTHAHNSRNE